MRASSLISISLFLPRLHPTASFFLHFDGEFSIQLFRNNDK